MARMQSDEAYSNWVDLREAEDALKAKIAEEEQATRWHGFQRDESNINQRATDQAVTGEMLLKILVILLALCLFGMALRSF